MKFHKGRVTKKTVCWLKKMNEVSKPEKVLVISLVQVKAVGGSPKMPISQNM